MNFITKTEQMVTQVPQNQTYIRSKCITNRQPMLQQPGQMNKSIKRQRNQSYSKTSTKSEELDKR